MKNSLTQSFERSLGVPVTCRLDTADKVVTYEAGGVLQKFAQDFLASEG